MGERPVRSGKTPLLKKTLKQSLGKCSPVKNFLVPGTAVCTEDVTEGRING